ncbi:MAG TPA: hypothetical protein VM617_01400 [Thermoanaerobaculia bacterium]|nr:hypothetical protein [Thermoanaerobaculia bacterium]
MSGPRRHRGRARRRHALALVALLVGPTLAASQPFSTGRGDVLLRRDCRSTIAREEVTLYGNGTVRLRSGPLGEERMILGEVPPEEVTALVLAFRGEDLADAGSGSAGPEGGWVVQCLLELPLLVPPSGEAVESDGPPSPDAATDDPASRVRRELPLGPGRPSGDLPATRFRYGHLDSLSLSLSRVVGRIDVLVAGVVEGAAAGSLPAGYRPRTGDVLRRADGVLFRVVRATADLEGMPRGWELQGVVQPLAVYVVESDLPREFVELVSRDGDDVP